MNTMTDNEITKALGACHDYSDCDNCRFGKYRTRNGLCVDMLHRSARDLINRQKSKIEALQMDNEQLQSDIVNANMNCEHLQAELEMLKQKQQPFDLPCKPGDTVYAFCDVFGAVLPYFIECFRAEYYSDSDIYYTFEANSNDIEKQELLDSIDFDLSDIGKTVLLTREEAIKKKFELSM